MFKRAWQQLRAAMAPSPESLLNVGKAVVFGTEQDAARTAELWAQGQQEREDMEAEAEQKKANGRRLVEACRRSGGTWFPGDPL